MRRALAAACAIWAMTALAATAPVAEPQAPLTAQVKLRPGFAKLGERVVYVGRVAHPLAGTVTWLAPDPGEDLHWGSPRTGLTRARAPTSPDTAWVVLPLQVFRLGRVSIPGLTFAIGGGQGEAPHLHRLPLTRLIVVPVLAASDSQASLRPLRGPMAAPWWERIAWGWVLAIALGLALVLALLLKRRRRVAPSPVAIPALDPAAEALAALEALRRLDLPASGRYAEHAFRLGQILRRYLEATVETPRPGDSTPELVAHLKDAAIEPGDLERLAGLLRGWDRIKFARDPCNVEESMRSERLVVDFVRRPAGTLSRVA